VCAVALIVSISCALDVPAGTLNVHITVCISHLPPVEFKNHYRRQRIKRGNKSICPGLVAIVERSLTSPKLFAV
jgi:hypothetical protein